MINTAIPPTIIGRQKIINHKSIGEKSDADRVVTFFRFFRFFRVFFGFFRVFRVFSGFFLVFFGFFGFFLVFLGFFGFSSFFVIKASGKKNVILEDIKS